MLSLTPRLTEPQRAQAPTVSTCPRCPVRVRVNPKAALHITHTLYSVLADDSEPDGTDGLRYVPGKARSHHLEMMLSKEELEEEQRSVKTTNTDAFPDKVT